jgi:hypothetical protein
LSRGDGDGSF